MASESDIGQIYTIDYTVSFARYTEINPNSHLYGSFNFEIIASPSSNSTIPDQIQESLIPDQIQESLIPDQIQESLVRKAPICLDAIAPTYLLFFEEELS